MKKSDQLTHIHYIWKNYCVFFSVSKSADLAVIEEEGKSVAILRSRR